MMRESNVFRETVPSKHLVINSLLPADALIAYRKTVW